MMRMFPRALAVLMAAVTGLALVLTPANADKIDCGLKPILECLAPHIFELARAQPERGMIEGLRFAEEELASANLGVALEYYLRDEQHPTEWHDITWLAKVGRFDRALKLAEEKPTPPASFDPLRRAGGLVSIAGFLGQVGQTRRAIAIMDKVEPELTAALQGEFPLDIHAAETWAELGKIDRSIRLLRRTDLTHMAADSALRLAKKHAPLAETFRTEAVRAAERANSGRLWLRLADEAAERGDVKAVTQLVQRARTAAEQDEPVRVGTDIARLLIRVGLRDEASKVMDAWEGWAAAENDWATYGRGVIDILAQLGRDDDVEAAARMVRRPFGRSLALHSASIELFRAGRTERAEKLEAQAIAIVLFVPDEDARGDRDFALGYLAETVAARGDVARALTLAAKIRNDIWRREKPFVLIERAIVAAKTASALESLQNMARETGEANLLLRVADRFVFLGQQDAARSALAEALAVHREQARGKKQLAFGPAAELAFKLDGNPQAVHARLREFVTTESERAQLSEAMINLIYPDQPGEAVRLAGELSDPVQRLDVLTRIATKIAEDKWASEAR